MKEITLPAGDWHIALAEAVKQADARTLIVVDTEAKAALAKRAADRMGKSVNVEVR